MVDAESKATSTRSQGQCSVENRIQLHDSPGPLAGCGVHKGPKAQTLLLSTKRGHPAVLQGHLLGVRERHSEWQWRGPRPREPSTNISSGGVFQEKYVCRQPP